MIMSLEVSLLEFYILLTDGSHLTSGIQFPSFVPHSLPLPPWSDGDIPQQSLALTELAGVWQG